MTTNVEQFNIDILKSRSIVEIESRVLDLKDTLNKVSEKVKELEKALEAIKTLI